MAAEPEPPICEPGGGGLLFPVGGEAEQRLDRGLRAALYAAGLLYCFLGVSVVADMFIAAIEAITSRRRRVLCKETGRFVTVAVWNETVANLTLMALGSSAPEIMLSVVEVLNEGCYSGELGPGTIVGSGAFNLLVIVAACIVAIPCSEVRRINQFPVFLATAACSVLAYIWLLLIVQVISPGIVEVWEAVATLLQLPVLVVVSYAVDVYCCPQTGEGPRPEAVAPRDEEVAVSRAASTKSEGPAVCATSSTSSTVAPLPPLAPASPAVQRRRSSVCSICTVGAATGVVSRRSSVVSIRAARAFQAPMKAVQETSVSGEASLVTVVPCQELALEDGCSSAHSVEVAARHSDTPSSSRTSGASAPSTAASARRTSRRTIGVVPAPMPLLAPDAVICDACGKPVGGPAGVITFSSDSVEVPVGAEERTFAFTVYRRNRTKSPASCKYRSCRLSAVPGYDYRECCGELTFAKGATSAEIRLTVLPKQIGERTDQFQVVLDSLEGDALFNPNDDGGEESCILTITIRNENETQDSIHARLSHICDGVLNLDEVRLGSAVWLAQIRSMARCDCAGGGEDDEEPPGPLARLFTAIAWPWSLLYGMLVPPPVYCGGWVCFLFSLVHIGILTAVVCDLAKLFGCVAGLKDTVTAISFVALGTSMPDFFASRTAALQDEFADASIVNVTGSNSVNVFLGIGLPWTMSAVYWAVQGPTAKWKSTYPEAAARYPDGAFVVRAGDFLAFNVVVFSVTAVVTIAVIILRRSFLGGELGGPLVPKAASAFLLASLWIYYVGLCSWRSKAADAPLGQVVLAVAVGLVAVLLATALFGLVVAALQASGDCRRCGSRRSGHAAVSPMCEPSSPPPELDAWAAKSPKQPKRVEYDEHEAGRCDGHMAEITDVS